MRYRLSQIAAICGGEHFGEDIEVREVQTDSRLSAAGSASLFVAMCGVNHDSHCYIDQMARRGVRALLVERAPDHFDGGYVVVLNSICALQRLAAHHRQSFKGKVIAITGSNGKSIVKEWIAQLVPHSVSLFRSPRSYNSQLGVALSLLMAEGDEQFVVIEAGVSQSSEMARLEQMIKPECVLFTSIGEAHQQGFESLEQKIGQKMVLAQSAHTLIYNSCYAELKQWFLDHPFGGEVVDAAAFEGGDFSDSASRSNSQIVEALMAHYGLGEPAFGQLQPVAMRLEVREGINDSIIINDSYNSDINSLSIALDKLNSVASSRETTLILSPILQSGTSPRVLYERVAQIIYRAHVGRLICVGGQLREFADLFTVPTEFYSSTDELLRLMNRADFAGRALLLKGNRESRFERVAHALERSSHTTVLEVNLDAIVHNLNHFRSKLNPQTKLVAMVKASSYGAGDFEIAQELQHEGVDYLAVAFADEGVLLRERGITMPIIVLNADDGSFDKMIGYNLEPEIYSLRSLNDFVARVRQFGAVNYPIHIKIDSGMHRLGFEREQIADLGQALDGAADAIRVSSIFTHMSTADMDDEQEYALMQLAEFEALSEQICTALGYRPLRHAAATAAMVRFPQAHFDMCRLGIGLYGIGGDELRPISTLKSRIVQIKHHAVGQSIGYGRAARLERESIIATIPIGYADGLDRHLGCGAWSMLVNGQAAPIVGRVCMDSCMIDITDIEGVVEGDQVIIFSNRNGNRAEDMASVLDTITYEVLTSVSRRVKRIYIKE